MASTTLALLVSTFIALSPTGSLIPSQLVSIAQCESGLQQFNNDGSLVVDSVTGTHVGIYQLGPHWQTLAKTFGLDVVNSPKDNITMALWIYNTRGTKDWLASEGCWGKLAIAPS